MKENFDSLVNHLMGHGFFLEEAVELLEKSMIGRALERTKGNRCAASKMLGIHRNTLQRKIEGYGIEESKKALRKPVGKSVTKRARSKSA